MKLYLNATARGLSEKLRIIDECKNIRDNIHSKSMLIYSDRGFDAWPMYNPYMTKWYVGRNRVISYRVAIIFPAANFRLRDFCHVAACRCPAGSFLCVILSAWEGGQGLDRKKFRLISWISCNERIHPVSLFTLFIYRWIVSRIVEQTSVLLPCSVTLAWRLDLMRNII